MNNNPLKIEISFGGFVFKGVNIIFAKNFKFIEL